MPKKKLALYALTRPGLFLAKNISQKLPETDLFLPTRLVEQGLKAAYFESLAEVLTKTFNLYDGHIIIAATGLVVRLLAPLIKDKKNDPAVVTLGQDGRFVISLLSGHLGGANDLATRVATITGGLAVINTATDIAGQPAMEVLARDLDFKMDFTHLPAINRILSENDRVPLWDPDNYLKPHLTAWPNSFEPMETLSENQDLGPMVAVDYRLRTFPPQTLIMRPPALAMGLGCHRGIDTKEVTDLALQTLESGNLAKESVHYLTSVETRRNEPAFLEISQLWQKELLIFTKNELGQILTPNPSETVKHNIGVPSVCEAAAIMAARMGQLLITKQKSARATCAIALIDWTSSALVPEEPTD